MVSVDAIAGVMLGTALGDALGLPHEGLHPRRIERRLRRRPFGHSMLGARGLLSDDTEHTCMVARALVESGGGVDGFRGSLARQLKWWVATLPPGIGFATLRGAIKLLCGVSPDRSGVRSAGNGPAMRSALLGVCARDDDHLVELVRASTRITHTDPRAEDGALVVARLARLAASRDDPVAPVQRSPSIDATLVFDEVRDSDLRARLHEAVSLAKGGDIEAFRVAAGYERGVSGFIVHTVPAAVYAWQRHGGRPERVLETAVRMGGDTDTVAAIAGALVGAEVGASALPRAWVLGLRDWPITVAHLEALASALACGTPAPRLSGLGALVRNLAVLAIVFAHVGLRVLGR